MKQVAITAALEAGKILKENFGKIVNTQIDVKQKFDFVTFVDQNSEKTIISIIREQYPDHKFYAEETARDDKAEYRWIIDPLDGTTNYIHGFPGFSISIALEHNQEVVLGVIYDPMREELFVAEKGKGATLNGNPVHVSDIEDPAKSLLTTGFPFRIKEHLDLYLQAFKLLFMQVSGIRRLGSAALDLSYLACGRCEGFWEIGLSPWDIAAGYLLVKEAGGKVTDFAGNDCPIWTGNVVASNVLCHKFMLDIIKKVFKGRIDK